jgi:anthranilate synthase component 2
MNKNDNKEILLIDNFDSFSYNIVELLRSIKGINLTIRKNDDSIIFKDTFDGIIISPGPGLPVEAGFLLKAIEFNHKSTPILGICLGLQAIVEHYGGELKQLPKVFHGIRDKVKLLDEHSESPLFKNIPTSFFAGRYHSWVGAQNQLPEELRVTALGSDGEIMAIENKADKVYAVQFHPESYMTEYGLIMLQNFIHLLSRKEMTPALGSSSKS